MYKSQIFRLRERRKRNWPKLKGVSPLSKCSSTANTFWELRISGLKILHACPAYSQLLGGSLRCLLSKWPINGQRGRMWQRGKTSIRSGFLFFRHWKSISRQFWEQFEEEWNHWWMSLINTGIIVPFPVSCWITAYQCWQYIHWVGPVGWGQQESWRWWTRTGNVKKYQVAWFCQGVQGASCKLELTLFLAILRGARLMRRMLTAGMGDKRNRGISTISQFEWILI